MAFSVRYNALIYPIIATITLLLSRQSIARKLLVIGAGFLFVAAFVFFTAGKYKELTGVWEFSPFSGWQIANNAIYAYRYVESESRKECPERLHELDYAVRHYIDELDLEKHPAERLKAGTVYMWDDRSPLVT
jgi:hypothetical protein